MKVLKKRNVDLKDYCTFKVGGKAKIMFFPKSAEEVKHVVCYFHKKGYDAPLVLGNGSNILFCGDFKGAVINMRGLDKITLSGNEVTCGAGVNLFALNKFCAENALEGLEFSYGIPGSVGGAIAMNAGAYGGEICAHLQKMIVLKNGSVYEKEVFSYSYRSGPLEEGEVLLEAIFKLKSGKKEDILSKQQEFLQKRRSSQPYSKPSAGSVFKRRGEIIPAKLIDEWGLKGLKIGGAMISPVHAGFIVNEDNATWQDVETLIELVEQVAKGHGYQFEREIKLI